MLDEKTKQAALAAVDALMKIVDQADAGKLPAAEDGPVDAPEAPPDAPEDDAGADGVPEADEPDEASEVPGSDEDDFMAQMDEMARPEAGHGPEIQKTLAMLKAKKKGE